RVSAQCYMNRRLCPRCYRELIHETLSTGITTTRDLGRLHIQVRLGSCKAPRLASPKTTCDQRISTPQKARCRVMRTQVPRDSLQRWLRAEWLLSYVCGDCIKPDVQRAVRSRSVRRQSPSHPWGSMGSCDARRFSVLAEFRYPRSADIV